MLTVGGIGEKLAMLDGRPVVREYLNLTVSVDHDLIDGAPAARFTQRLKELIESGYGLDLDPGSPKLEPSLAGVHGEP
jgi:pyruvate/2-oxoglutarate dehydrogenase complex dihydrolipoamide acyltransferase (E2) component